MMRFKHQKDEHHIDDVRVFVNGNKCAYVGI